MKAVFFGSTPKEILRRVYPPDILEKLTQATGISEEIIGYHQLEEKREVLSKVKYLFSTWGMPECSEEEIREYFPSLNAVFYGAGSVQAFARPFLNSGVRVFSAWAANAVPVAEYTVSQIILANKGFFQASVLMKQGKHQEAVRFAQTCPGNYGAKVGIIGVGMIGSLVAEMLKPYRLEVLAYDPLLSDEKAAGLGIQKCSLEKLFLECQIISNHLANNCQTQGVLDGNLFSRMKRNAVFINTGRGAQVVEADLVKALRDESGRTAILDVTHPEPPLQDHPFYQMDNVVLTPHIAGSMGTELARMGQYMLEEFIAFSENKHLKYEVTLHMLEIMA